MLDLLRNPGVYGPCPVPREGGEGRGRTDEDGESVGKYTLTTVNYAWEVHVLDQELVPFLPFPSLFYAAVSIFY